jgi:hypothetical protein
MYKDANDEWEHRESRPVNPAAITYKYAALGRHDNDNNKYFTGALRGVRLYARALPGEELAAIHTPTAAPTASPTTPPIGILDVRPSLREIPIWEDYMAAETLDHPTDGYRACHECFSDDVLGGVFGDPNDTFGTLRVNIVERQTQLLDYQRLLQLEETWPECILQEDDCPFSTSNASEFADFPSIKAVKDVWMRYYVDVDAPVETTQYVLARTTIFSSFLPMKFFDGRWNFSRRRAVKGYSTLADYFGHGCMTSVGRCPCRTFFPCYTKIQWSGIYSNRRCTTGMDIEWKRSWRKPILIGA